MGIYSGTRRAYKNVRFALGERPAASIRASRAIMLDNENSELIEAYEDLENKRAWAHEVNSDPNTLKENLELIDVNHNHLTQILKSRGLL